MRGPEGIERSQRKLFRSIQKELRHLEKAKGREIRAYERAFRKSMPADFAASTKRALIARGRGAAVLLVGDYHSFRQSQKGFLRLVKEVREASSRPAIIALECIQQRFQPQLDYYAEGLITAEELRDEINFERHWPFAWENYREILEYARSEALPLLALNADQRAGTPELKVRDQAAATRIAAALQEFPGAQVFALFGELHLAEPHLPAELRRRLSRKRVLTVHQNDTELYWAAPRSRLGQRPEVLRLRPDEFCILNSVPWMKLRSYLDWAEGSAEDDWDAGTDVQGTVTHFAAMLAEAVGLEAPSGDDVEIFGPEGLPDWAPRLVAGERALLRHARDFQRVAYLPGAKAILLPSLSTNALTEAASLLIWAKANRAPAEELGPRLLLQYVVAYLGSKIRNPQRKCNEEADLNAYLASLPPAKRARDAKAQVFRRAQSLLAPYLGGRRVSAVKLSGSKELEAHRIAGYLLGNRLFLSLQRRQSAVNLTRDLYTSSASAETWARRMLDRIGAELGQAELIGLSKRDSF